MGVFATIGVTKSRKRSIEALWAKDHLFNIPIYRTIFSRNRFKTILAHLRFDDTTTRAERIRATGDKLQAFREIIELIKANCIKAYDPSKWMTVDERLQAFRGKFFGKVYIMSKPGKFGIKIWVICDALNFYAFNFQVYFPGRYHFLTFKCLQTLLTMIRFKVPICFPTINNSRQILRFL